MRTEFKGGIHYMWFPELKGPRNWSVTMDGSDANCTYENDIEADTYWATLELAQEHARRILARLPRADVSVIECVIRDAPMTDAEYEEHRRE